MLAAPDAAAMIDELTSNGPITMFVPGDADATSAEGTLEPLIGDDDRLRDVILSYAVVGKLMAADAIELAGNVDGSALESVGGETLSLQLDGDTLMVGPVDGEMAAVVLANIESGNVTV